MASLREQSGTSARALQFCILTAARSGEVLGARWSEIDIEARVWTVPAARMKGGREHRVPLSLQAVSVLEAIRPFRMNDLVFPGVKRGRTLSNRALRGHLVAAGVVATPHGFRSSFRDWSGDCTDFPREIAEAALAHIVGDKAEQAYRRGDALEKRRALMDQWADYIDIGPR